MTDTLSHSFVVPEQLDGERLDRALVYLFDGWSRSRIVGLVKEGRVQVDELPQIKPGHMVEQGQVLQVQLPEPPPVVTEEEARARLPLLHVDEHLIVVDKPAGVLVHRADAHHEPSIAEYAVALFGELPSLQGADRPGIAHRLDRETSGVLVLARTEPALEDLMRQFREREVEKTYLALVHGDPRFDSDWIESPLGRSKRHPDRITVRPEGEGREARTFYTVRERFEGHSFIECQPKTGRTHQIRVHLASIGHSVVGDHLYAPRGRKLAPWPGGGEMPGRQMLHAARLAFQHPVLAQPLVFESSSPADFSAALEQLRA